MNRRHMSGDHHGRTARRATPLVTATYEILGTHRVTGRVQYGPRGPLTGDLSAMAAGLPVASWSC
jgi:hypothetical protein